MIEFARVVWLLLSLTTVGLSIWTFKDANINSTHPSILWSIVVFVCGVIGLLIYKKFGRNDK